MLDENKNAVKVFNELAEIYQQKYMNVDSQQDSLNFLSDQLNPGDLVLDLACGPGNILLHLSEKNPKLAMMGIDLSEKMIALAQKNVPNAKFKIADCRDLSSITSKNHAVICSFLIPYLKEADVEKLITSTSRLLISGGVLYLGFIAEEKNRSENVKSSGGHNVTMNYYSTDFIIKILINNGYTVVYSAENLSDANNQVLREFIIVATI